MTSKTITLKPFYISVGFGIVLALLFSIKLAIIPAAALDWAKEYTRDKNAPIIFEGAIYWVFILAGAAGYFYAQRSMTENGKHNELLFAAVKTFLSIGGLFVGLLAGELLYQLFSQHYSAMPSYLLVLVSMILLTIVPAWIAWVILEET